MIKLLGNLPTENIGLALSGGIDSMTIAHFLINGRKDFKAFYFNHGTEHGEKAEKFVRQWCQDNNVPLEVELLDDDEYNDRVWQGPQEFYRFARYMFLGEHSDHNIILGHHLDDVLETWLFSTFHGSSKLIQYKVGHCIRPFLLSSKEDIRAYAERHNVKWIEDESNSQTDYMRNHIRHNIVPEVEKVNPGIRKHIARMVYARYNKDYGNELFS